MNTPKILQSSFFILMLTIAAVIMLAPTISIFSQYMGHFLFLFLLLGICLLILKQERLMLTSFAISGMLCVFLKNQSNDDLVLPEKTANPSIITQYHNLADLTQPSELYKAISENQPDVLTLFELTPDWNSVLHDTLLSLFPYYVSIVRVDPYGKAVYSKYPIQHTDTIWSKEKPDLSLTIVKEDIVFENTALYIEPPLDKVSTQQALEQLGHLQNHLDKNEGNKIVYGEFNMVYWADGIREFRETSGLSNSRRQVLPVNFDVPYDHIFYSKSLECLGVNDIKNSNNEKIGYTGSYQITLPTANIELSVKN